MSPENHLFWCIAWGGQVTTAYSLIVSERLKQHEQPPLCRRIYVYENQMNYILIS